MSAVSLHQFDVTVHQLKMYTIESGSNVEMLNLFSCADTPGVMCNSIQMLTPPERAAPRLNLKYFYLLARKSLAFIYLLVFI